MIAYCGIDCTKCDAYKVTKNQNTEKINRLMIEWGTRYRRSFLYDDIQCYGCKSDKRFILCSKCDIERCNKNKQLNECKECNDYKCARYKSFESSLEGTDLLV